MGPIFPWILGGIPGYDSMVMATLLCCINSLLMIERQKKKDKKTIDNTVNKNISYFYMKGVFLDQI